MKNIIFLFHFFLSLNSISQEVYNDSLLKQDFDILTNILCEVSPNINFEEKEALYNYLNKRSKELNGKTMTVIEFFKFLMDSEPDTKLDDHASISISNDVLKELFANKNVLFPIPIIVIDNKLIVNHENSKIRFGSVISEINGMTVFSILDNILEEKNASALRNLEHSFDLIYLITYGAPKSYDVTYTSPNTNQTKTIKLIPIGINKRERIYSNLIYPINNKHLKNTINTAYFEN